MILTVHMCEKWSEWLIVLPNYYPLSISVADKPPSCSLHLRATRRTTSASTTSSPRTSASPWPLSATSAASASLIHPRVPPGPHFPPQVWITIKNTYNACIYCLNERRSRRIYLLIHEQGYPFFYSWGTHFSSCSWVEGGGTVVDGFRSGKVVEDSFGASRYAGDFRGKKQIEVTGERKFRNKLLSVRFSTINS